MFGNVLQQVTIYNGVKFYVIWYDGEIESVFWKLPQRVNSEMFFLVHVGYVRLLQLEQAVFVNVGRLSSEHIRCSLKASLTSFAPQNKAIVAVNARNSTVCYTNSYATETPTYDVTALLRKREIGVDTIFKIGLVET